MAGRILTRTERATAWLATGALAHLIAGVTDWLLLMGRYGRSRWRARRTT